MKSNNEFRPKVQTDHRDEVMKKAVKLAPNKKSGKDKHNIYSLQEDDDDDLALSDYRKPESAFDYFEDEEDD